MPDNDIIERLRTGGEGRPATDGEWRSFQRCAHRSLAVRRGGAALALIVLVVGGLFGGDNLLLRTSDDRIDTVRSPDPSPTTTEERRSARESFWVEYWVVRDGVLTWSATYWDAASGERPMEAMNLLLSAPTGPDQEAGDTSDIPTGTQLLGIQITDGVATVDFSAPFDGEGSDESRRTRAAQVAYTLTQFPQIESVQLLVEGEPYEATPEPVGRDDFFDLAPPILVDTPHPNEVISSPVTVSGSADVFEGTVLFRVSDRNGRMLAQDFTTTTCGSGCRGEFSKSMSFDVGEKQVGRMEVFWTSAEDGSQQDVISLPVTLEP